MYLVKYSKIINIGKNTNTESSLRTIAELIIFSTKNTTTETDKLQQTHLTSARYQSNCLIKVYFL